jgi:hypothetical protein
MKSDLLKKAEEGSWISKVFPGLGMEVWNRGNCRMFDCDGAVECGTYGTESVSKGKEIQERSNDITA